MKPYYADDAVTIYHGDCRETLTGLVWDVLLTDPPYGIGADSAQRGRAGRRDGKAATASRDYGASDWDSSVPDAYLLEHLTERPAIVWGGNFMGLPPSACWLVWDKDNGTNGYADCELAWTNLTGAVRRLRWRWMGMLQELAGADKEVRVHPTQKPEPVMQWCIGFLPPGTLLDPFMGSGTTLRAAKDLGRKAIGIEIEERYCEIAARRCAQEVLL